MSDEQQHEGGRKPQTSHASKSHAPKSGHVADSWRELAEDARQWVDGHRLAVVATTVLVVLNLVVWLVAAMAGFAFPLRLDTSMAEFDLGKLVCSLFLARGVIQLIIDAVLWLVMFSIAEPWLGRTRTVAAALACAAAGAIIGLGLCAAAGWLFQDSQFVSRMRFALSPLVLPVGALMAASAFCGHLWRRRIRLIGYVAILVALLYSGNPGDYCILAAALLGHIAGRVMAGPPAHAETGWHWLRSTSFEARRMFAAIAVVLALGPVISITSHNHAGPLSTVGLLMSPASVDNGTLAKCLAGATHSGCFLQFDLLRASMPGAVLRSLLPTAVTLVLVLPKSTNKIGFISFTASLYQSSVFGASMPKSSYNAAMVVSGAVPGPNTRSKPMALKRFSTSLNGCFPTTIFPPTYKRISFKPASLHLSLKPRQSSSP